MRLRSILTLAYGHRSLRESIAWDGRGWWVSPTGAVMPVTNHDKYIMENPDEFGADPEIVRHMFTVGTPEGEAATEFRKSLTRDKGWVRISNMGGTWGIEYNGTSSRVLSMIQDAVIGLGRPQKVDLTSWGGFHAVIPYQTFLSANNFRDLR